MERLDIVNRLIQTIAQNTNTIGSEFNTDSMCM